MLRSRIYSKVTLIALTLLSLALFFQYELFAQTSGLSGIIEDLEELIAGWENEAAVSLALVVAIGTLGILVGLFQKLKVRWASTATLIAGVLVSALTLFHNSAFNGDHRELRRMACEGHKKLTELKLLVDLYGKADAQDQEVILKDFRRIKDEIYDIEGQKYAWNETSISLIPAAFAQNSQPPEWVSMPPSDRKNFYFVGVGYGDLMAVAKEDANQHAIVQAVDYIAETLYESRQNVEEINIDAVAEFVVESSREEERYFTFDEERGIYVYYLLMSINKRSVTTDLELYAIQEKVDIPEDYARELETREQDPDDYQVRQRAIELDRFEETKFTTPEELFDKFSHGRMLRKEGLFEEAIALLEEVTSEDPEFYLAWYNLALAYDEIRWIEPAEHAYQRAIELEPLGSSRDASVYEAYGYFLFNNDSFAEAIPILEKALMFNPENQKTARYLKIAEAEAGP
jgi:tetratricopeptide (TPR) repeat protein